MNMYLIRVSGGYFSARRGYFGGVGTRAMATLFTLADATDRAGRMVGATAERAWR